MPYDQWVNAVDLVLKSSKRKFRAQDILESVLEDAYINDVSPVVFAMQPDIPLKPKGMDLGEWRDGLKWVPILAVVAVCAWAARQAVTVVRADDAGRKMGKVKYPIDLPIKTKAGDYYPDGAEESAKEAETIIRDYLMSKKDVEIEFSEPVRALAYGKFLIRGGVTAKNKFGTPISGNYEMVVYRRYRATGSDDKGNLRYVLHDPQWLYEEPRLFASGDTIVWKRRDVEPFERFGQEYSFQQSKSAAKKTSTLGRRTLQFPPSNNIYTSDRE